MNDDDEFLNDLSSLTEQLKHPSKMEEQKEKDDIDEMIEEIDGVECTEVVHKPHLNVPVTTDDEDTEILPSVTIEKHTKEEIQDYVLERCKKIIANGFDTLEGIQDTVINTCDGKAINGYATIIASLGKVLDTANAIGLEKSRVENNVEMENLKHKHKTEIKAVEKPAQHNTMNIIAGREEIMKMLSQEQ